jgi:hypothetical protein
MNAGGPERVVGRRLSTDGLERDVHEDAQGRQYVLDGNGERVYGQWLYPADEPHVVAEGGRTSTNLSACSGSEANARTASQAARGPEGQLAQVVPPPAPPRVRQHLPVQPHPHVAQDQGQAHEQRVRPANRMAVTCAGRGAVNRTDTKDRCNRSSEGVTSGAEVAAGPPGDLPLGKFGLGLIARLLPSRER